MLSLENNRNLHEMFWKIFPVILLSYFIYKLYIRRPFVNAINKLPGMRLGFYYPVGHVNLMLPQRIRKLPFSSHVYDLHVVLGYAKLFHKSGFHCAWQLNQAYLTVFKADIVEMVLNHSNELTKAWFYKFLEPWLEMGLLTSPGENWRKKRKLLTPAFHFNILKDFLLIFNKQSNILVDILEKHTRDKYIDILPVITRCSLDIICETILGKEMHTQTQPFSSYVKAVTKLTSLVYERVWTPWLWPTFLYGLLPVGRKFYKNKSVVHNFTNKVIAEMKKAKLEIRASEQNFNELEQDCIYQRKKRALLDLLLDEHIKNNSISEAEIREEVDTFTFEGHDTTSMAMSWSLYLIGLYPWVQEKIHNELDSIFEESDRDATDEDLKNMKYLDCVLKETLRLYPSVAIFGRELKDDLNYNGYVIPGGITCIINPYVLHRDPEVFPNPEKFDPDRFSAEKSAGRHAFAYVPFSAGPRNCIGQRFALMEEKTVISSIMRRYKLRSLDPRDKVHPMDELVLRPNGELRIQIRKRGYDFDFDSVYYRP